MHLWPAKAGADDVNARLIKVDEVNRTVTLCGGKAEGVGGGDGGDPAKHFSFDHVFGPSSKQVDVYNQAARPIVHNVLQGYNGTIFAYGQTGTGKTFTMEGNREVPELKGIIPNSFAHIFGHIAQCQGDIRFLVRVSYLEIYNEEIRDLMGKDQKKNLDLKERPDVGVYVRDLTVVTVSGADEMDRIMTMGNKNRSVGATNMNEHSSRSHAIFSVIVECSEKGKLDNQQHVRVGKLHLVDLAGSERQTKTGATGQRLKEATKINLSLSTLGNVISALVDAKTKHIPYRNSKLTRMLQDSLGGNSKTVMIANFGPADYNVDETMSTLRYANRAKNIQNKAKINEDPKDALLRKFQQEIEELRKQLAEGGGSGGSSEDESGASGQSDASNDGHETGGHHTKHRHKKGISDDKLRELEAEILADKKKLEEEKGMEESAYKTLTETLAKKEKDLGLFRQQHEEMARKLEQLEKKVIHGGENLLEKAEAQARLLEQSQTELEHRKIKEAQLRQALEQKQAERLDIEEKYSSLQEEASGKTRKLKKVWNMLQAAKSETSDLQAEHQREMELMLDNVRNLSRELKFQQIIIDAFIPQKYQELIEHNCEWNEDVGDWLLRCVAYSGNNMSKDNQPETNAGDATTLTHTVKPPDFSNVYLSYVDVVGADLTKTKTRRGQATKKERDKAQLKALLK